MSAHVGFDFSLAQSLGYPFIFCLLSLVFFCFYQDCVCIWFKHYDPSTRLPMQNMSIFTVSVAVISSSLQEMTFKFSTNFLYICIHVCK